MQSGRPLPTRKKILISLLISFLCACSAAPVSSATAVPSGQYRLLRIDGGNVDSGIPEEEIRDLEEYGLDCTLTISHDGNAVLNIYGEELKYMVKDSCLISPDTEEKIKFRIEDNTILIEDSSSGQSLSFVKYSEENPNP